MPFPEFKSALKADEKLRAQLGENPSLEHAIKVANANGFAVTMDELTGELSDDDLDQVAGAGWYLIGGG